MNGHLGRRGHKIERVPYMSAWTKPSGISGVAPNVEDEDSEARCVGVLIVEDEPLIRMDTVFVLESAGFEVHEASSADQAIAILETHPDIRVIFTDVHMPGSMDGLKLAHYVRGRWPPIKIIVTSGRVRICEQDLPSGSAFFDKPYRPEQIAQKLREMAA